MWFNSQEYFTKSQDPKLISDYFSFFHNGILIDVEPLYLLIVGKYDSENNTNFLKCIDCNTTDYELLRRFLNSLKNCPFFITSHTFTKFTHLLWENVKEPEHFYKIIDNFISHFGFIGEKYIHKDEIMNMEHFKKKYCDLSNTSLILTAEKYNHNSIITFKDKTARILQERGNILVVYYPEIKQTFQSLPSEH